MPPKKPTLTIQPTTLWEYPSQHYGKSTQGSARYAGATPSYVIWNLLERYTRANDLVVDPMCGSGTTIDVARDLGRRVKGFDLNPYRDDIIQGDARSIALGDETVDFVFVDPPYSTNLNYSDDQRCIGKLDAHEDAYFESLDTVYGEIFRVLKNRRFMAVYICDVWTKQGFVPIGARTLHQLSKRFRIVDHIAVVRHNRTLKMGNRRRTAVEENFFLRGYNHLIIAKKHD